MYVDGFVLAVPSDKKDAYRDHALKFWEVFKEFGALTMVECWGDDVPEGKLTSFPMAVQCEEGETVVFSWTTWPDKATRDKGWKDMMEDPRLKNMSPADNPFDGKRMIYGGFSPIVEVGG
jgi:uncharacterized protein YbaA (DUF1428 family)